MLFVVKSIEYVSIYFGNIVTKIDSGEFGFDVVVGVYRILRHLHDTLDKYLNNESAANT